MGYPPPFMASMALLCLPASFMLLVEPIDAFIPVGPICRTHRIIFSSEIFMSKSSSPSSWSSPSSSDIISNAADQQGPSSTSSASTTTTITTTTSGGPPLSFLDARYADLFRRTDGNGVTRPKQHKMDARRTSSSSKPRPIVRLDPKTGLYITEERPAVVVSTAAGTTPAEANNKENNVLSSSKTSIVRDAFLGSLHALGSITTRVGSAAVGVLKHPHSDSDASVVLEHPIREEEEDASAPGGTTTKPLKLERIASAHDDSPSTTSPLINEDKINDKEILRDGRQEEEEDKVLDAVGMAFGSASEGIEVISVNGVPPEEGETAVEKVEMAVEGTALDDATPDMVSKAVREVQEASSNNAQDDDATKARTVATDVQNLSPTSSINDKSEEAKAATEKDPKQDKQGLVPRPPSPPSPSLQVLVHPTLSEQGVRVVKSAAEAATKVAFFVGKAAFTLAVLVAKAALALDEERRVAEKAKAGPPLAITSADLDKEAADALKMAEDALSSAEEEDTSNKTEESKKRKRDPFFGLFGFVNKIINVSSMSTPTLSVSKVVVPHPPSPPPTLEALHSLESDLKKDISAALEEEVAAEESSSTFEEVKTPVMKVEVSKKIATSRLSIIEIDSAIKRAKAAAAKAVRDAEELEEMLLSMR